MSNDRAHPIFQALADAICPPAGDDLVRRAASDLELDDRISRLDLIRWLEDQSAAVRRRMSPETAWFDQDMARLYLLRQVLDHVNAAPSCEQEMWGAK